jgi:phosphatidylglycerophosphatase A
MQKSSPTPLKEQKPPRLKLLKMIYLTWFGSGLAPKAPGTFGTLASLPLWGATSYLAFTPWTLVVVIGLMTALAIVFAEELQGYFRQSDPSWIVIDEVLGMGLTLLLFPASHWSQWILAFASFRLFDIVKIWPARYFDQRVKNGFGTIADDLISGLYAAGFCHFAQYLYNETR